MTRSKYWFSTTVLAHRHTNRPSDSHRPSPDTDKADIKPIEDDEDEAEEETERIREINNAGMNWMQVLTSFNRPENMNCFRYLINDNDNNNDNNNNNNTDNNSNNNNCLHLHNGPGHRRRPEVT